MQLHVGNGLEDVRIVAEGQASPFIGNGCGACIGIPGETSEAVEICQRKRTAEPVRVETDVGNSGEAACRAMESFPGNDLFHWRMAAVHAQIEIEHALPHGRDEYQVALLPEVLLRDLQLDGLIRVLKAAKQRRRRLSHLEVDGAVLDLNDYVVVELAVERMEIIVSRLGAIVLEIGPVEVMVIDESTIENVSTVRLQRARDYICRIRRSSSVGCGTQLSFG